MTSETALQAVRGDRTGDAINRLDLLERREDFVRNDFLRSDGATSPSGAWNAGS
jgi:hypothetical protein